MVGRRRFATALPGAAAALMLAAAPWNIGENGFSTHAAAGQETSNQETSSGSGKGNAGNGNGSGGNAGKSNSGKSNSGKSSAARGIPDTSSAAAAQQAGSFGGGFRPKASEFNPVTGTMIEVNGSDVAVLHPDGILEKIVNGRYSMNDAQGRLIIERTSTESDRARFRTMLRR